MFSAFICSEAHSAEQPPLSVFAPKYGYLEDPATGSGNAAFGYRLLEESRWDGDFIVEQGSMLDNPSFVKLRKHETEDGLRMLFGGCGTTRIEGFYCYHR
jgi:predicted PhzF superfamily epimerase YddE/YHI9